MDVRINGMFNFLADFDDKNGTFADALDASQMVSTMKAALLRFFGTQDIDVVPMCRQATAGAGTSVHRRCGTSGSQALRSDRHAAGLVYYI